MKQYKTILDCDGNMSYPITRLPIPLQSTAVQPTIQRISLLPAQSRPYWGWVPGMATSI